MGQGVGAQSLTADAARHLRVLFLAPQPFFEVRGTPLAVLAMVRAVTGLGHQVELLTYSQSLTSITGGRGDYTMHFLRYEEVPPHVAQKVIDETRREREAAKAS